MEENKVKELVTDLDKLSEISDNIDIRKDGNEMRDTILYLKNTMEAKGLLALSAPQIGIQKRIFCVKTKNKKNNIYTTFVNPMIKKSTDMTFSREKDECFPDKEYIYPRSGKIVVNYLDPLGNAKCTNVAGYSAFVFQRMIDHFNGALISDIGLEIDDKWDKATEEERAEVLKAYMDSLDMVSKKLEEEISNDENLKNQKKAIEFEKALIAGEIVTEQREFTEEETKAVKTKYNKEN